MAVHSPLPWSLAERRFVGNRIPAPFVNTTNGRMSIDCTGSGEGAGQDVANAEFIVRAANAHAALVDALQTIEAIICDKSLCGHFTAEEIRDVVTSALAKVK